MYATTNSHTRSEATPGASGRCPGCGATVIAKCGEINAWHWAHRSNSDCDPWAEPVGVWHRAWQSRFHPSCRERVMANHRADIAIPGAVLELQHSPLSVAEIRERERFYSARGSFCWLFDVTEAERSERLDVRNQSRGDSYCTFRWKHARRSLAACRQPVYLDRGNGLVLRVGRIYTEAPVGGWGHSMTADEFLFEFTRARAA